jgi:acetylornithine/N-succinyldiaminopimelate aminotransferase
MSNYFYSEQASNLAEKLCVKTGLAKACFGNSGAEANECAIKVARKYSFDKYGKGRNEIITLVNSFHGRTVTTLSATGQEVFHNYFFPFTEGFSYVEAGDFDALTNAVTDKTCAVMLELIQGEGGVNILNKEYVQQLVEFCNEKDILVIVDEVQTGNGRTGKLYGYMNYDIQPDVVTTAKGIGGGLPIGLCMLGEKMKDVFTPGTHGSTFGGNPVCCAGALSIMSRIDDELMAEVAEKSKYIISELEGAKGVKSVSGMGLMLGIETERPAPEIIKEAMERGVLVLSAKTKVRLLPPLNIVKEDLMEAITILKEVIGK